ncbi:MAG: CRISPR-associated endonuclease Cas1 [Bacteroidota bacterium]
MAGSDGVTVDRFALHLDAEMDRLARDVLTETYQPEPLFAFEIPKASGGRRKLAVPTVRDRVVQGAALEALTPLVERELSESTYAYREGRSVQQAVAEIERLRDEGYRYVVDADVESFFDTVDHDRLIERVGRLVDDSRVLRLIRAWVSVDAMWYGRRVSRSRGLPQGSALSPLLANLVLDDLDEALEADGHRIVRYADDFVILARTADRAEDALELTEETLASLKLRLHPEKTALTTFETGFRFLGTLFVRSLALPSAHPLQIGVPRTTPSAPSLIPADLGETALGRAFQAALDAEGLRLDDLLARLDSPDPVPLPPEPLDTPPPTPIGPQPPAEPEPFDLAPGAEPLMRTLYIETQGAWLRVQRDRFRVTVGRDPRKEVLEVPVAEVDRVLLFGTCLVTPAALRRCFREHITVAWVSRAGRPYGQTEAARPDHAARIQRQALRQVDAEFRLRTSVSIIRAKLSNTRRLLRRLGPGNPPVVAAANEHSRLIARVSKARDLDTVRGLEGQAAAVYFDVFGHLIRNDGFSFDGREKRPPTDPINALLSFGYTLLHQNVHAMLRLHRLSPYIGVLHAHRPGHPALASDLVEEWRFLAERLALRLVNEQTLSPDDFAEPEGRGVRLRPEARRRYLRAFEATLHRRVLHPDASAPVSYRRCMELQVRRYVQALQGLPTYSPFRFT